MIPDQALLERLEAGLDPRYPESSAVPLTIIGCGEISAIFRIGDDTAFAYKRLPLFDSITAARVYAQLYNEYCRLLRQAGLTLPDSATAVVALPGRPVVLYIAQQAFPSGFFAHKRIHRLPAGPAGVDRIDLLLRRIVSRQFMIRDFNRSFGPDLEIAVDGQLSNWVIDGDPATGPVCYIDTSTPFIRRRGKHQLDAELLLRSAPLVVRPLLRRLFLADILDRYYDPRRNLIDLAANLFKEQRPDLIPLVLTVINRNLPDDIQPLSEKDVVDYYRLDRYIWAAFLALRRLDRFTTTRLLGRRYEFMLPGHIRR